jgi:hypothetical protein
LPWFPFFASAVAQVSMVAFLKERVSVTASEYDILQGIAGLMMDIGRSEGLAVSNL